MSVQRRFLILHGVENRRPPEHWQHHLAEELRARREVVLYPQLPDADRPNLESWLELIRAELAQLGKGQRVVICHSLGGLAWLQLAGRLEPDERVDRLLLVAPPSPAILWPEIAAFSPPEHLTGETLQQACGSTRLVCSDNDPYCPEGAQTVYGAPFALETDLISSAGHLSIDDGYGPWPSALQWCLSETKRLTGR